MAKAVQCSGCGSIYDNAQVITGGDCCDGKTLQEINTIEGNGPYAGLPEVTAPRGGLKFGEVRTTSETGGQKGVKPQRMSLLPFRALAKISEVYGFGEKKYSAHNWRLGYEWDKSIDALERHIGAFKDGEDNDPESGLSHIAHAGFHILTLLVFILDPRYKRFDNRWATMEERKRNETPSITINPSLQGMRPR
jgi:hypothetical protein